MTNAMIIFQQSQALAEAGKINYTGRVFTMETADGQTITLKETEEIHTFAAWKARGFSVKKGARAVAAFPVWKYRARTRTDEETGEEIDESKMFLKTASFFSASQVEIRQAV